MDTTSQEFIVKITPDFRVELNVPLSSYPDRRDEAQQYPKSEQYFLGRHYDVGVILINKNIRRKHELGIFIGPSPQFCDLVISDRTNSEIDTPAWGLITFDKYDRLIYRDVRHVDENHDNNSHTGSGVSMGKTPNETHKRNEIPKRRGFSWVLSGSDFLISQGIVAEIHLTKYISLVIEVPDGGRISKPRAKSFHNAPYVYKLGSTESSGFEKKLCLDPHDLRQNVVLNCNHVARDAIVLKDDIGKGSYGTVRRHYNVSTGVCTAVKKPIDTKQQHMMECAWKEIELFKKIAKLANTDRLSKDYSQYVIKLIRCETEPSPKLEVEFAPYGTLQKQHKERKMSILETVCALEQTLKAVSFFHRFEMAHRDIKPDNVLVQKRNPTYRESGDISIRVADFGMSKIGNHKTRPVGTSRYNAPELFGDGEYYTTAVDIWSIGVMFYDIYFGFVDHIPFLNENSPLDLYALNGRAMCANIAIAIDKTARSQSPEALLAKFIRDHMVQDDPGRRLSADECLKNLKALRSDIERFEPEPNPYTGAMLVGAGPTARASGGRTTSTYQSASTSTSSHYSSKLSNGSSVRSNWVAHARGHNLAPTCESSRPQDNYKSNITLEDEPQLPAPDDATWDQEADFEEVHEPDFVALNESTDSRFVFFTPARSAADAISPFS